MQTPYLKITQDISGERNNDLGGILIDLHMCVPLPYLPASHEAKVPEVKVVGNTSQLGNAYDPVEELDE